MLLCIKIVLLYTQAVLLCVKIVLLCLQTALLYFKIVLLFPLIESLSFPLYPLLIYTTRAFYKFCSAGCSVMSAVCGSDVAAEAEKATMF